MSCISLQKNNTSSLQSINNTDEEMLNIGGTGTSYKYLDTHTEYPE